MKWFRFYSEALRDPKVQRLSDQTYRRWVNLLCLANEGKPRGQLPAVADIAFHLRISDDEADRLVDELIARELLDGTPDGYMPHNWAVRQFKSDNTYERVLKFRGKGDETFRETTGETLHETLPETPRRCSKPRNVSETFHSLLTETDSETDTEPEQRGGDSRAREVLDASSPAHAQDPPPPPVAIVPVPARATVATRQRATRAAPAPRPTALPRDFALTDEMRDWAAKFAPDADVDQQTARFIGRAKESGKKSLDWRASWESWMTNPYATASPASRGDAGTRSPPTLLNDQPVNERMARNLAALRASKG